MLAPFLDDGLRGNKNVTDRYDDINGTRFRDAIPNERGILVGINHHTKLINIKISKPIWLKCLRVRHFKMVWVKEERFVSHNDSHKAAMSSQELQKMLERTEWILPAGKDIKPLFFIIIFEYIWFCFFFAFVWNSLNIEYFN